MTESRAAAAAAANINNVGGGGGYKRVLLEGGGKDAIVVLADADVEITAQDAVTYSLENTGQVCCSIERIYVADAIYEPFVEAVTRHAVMHRVGNGLPTV